MKTTTVEAAGGSGLVLRAALADRRDNRRVPVKNNAPPSPLHWHRKLEQHTDSKMQALAEAFRDHVSRLLDIAPPTIYWFEEADADSASQAWLAFPRERTLPSEDPLRNSCEYFRWSARPGTIFHGYIHRESPLGIMVNARCRDEELLKAVAEECFHMQQDLRGEEWRAKNGSAVVEAEARKFINARTSEIHEFFEAWMGALIMMKEPTEG